MFNVWKISGIGLKDLFIFANSFDNALYEARKINKYYNTGVVIGIY